MSTMSDFEITEILAAANYGDDANVFAAAADVFPAGSVPLASSVPANLVVPAADDDFFASPFLAAGPGDRNLVFPVSPALFAASASVPAFAADDDLFPGDLFAAGPEEVPAFAFPASPVPFAVSPVAGVPAVPAYAAPAASVPVAAVDNSSFPADVNSFSADVANPAMSDNEFNVDMGNINADVGGNDGDNFFSLFGMGEAVDGNNKNNNNDGWAFLYGGNGFVNNDGFVNVQMPSNDLDDLLNDVLVAGTPAPGSNQADNLGPRLQAGEGYAQGGMEAPQPAVPSPVMLQPEPIAAPVQHGVPHPQAVQPQMPPASRPLARFPASRLLSRFPVPLQVPAPILTPLQRLQKLHQQQYQEYLRQQHHQQHLQQRYQQQRYQQQQKQGQQQQQQHHHQQHQQQQQQGQQQQQQHQEYQPWKFAKKVGPKTFHLELAASPIHGHDVSLVEQLRQHVREREAFANGPLPGPQGPAAPAAPAAAAAAPDADAPPVRRGPGRPKGAKNKNPRDPLRRVRGGARSRVARARPRPAADGEQMLAAAAAAAANEERQRPVEDMEGIQHRHQHQEQPLIHAQGQPPGHGGNMYVHAAPGGNAQPGGHVDVEEIIREMRANGTFTRRQERTLRALYNSGM